MRPIKPTLEAHLAVSPTMEQLFRLCDELDDRLHDAEQIRASLAKLRDDAEQIMQQFAAVQRKSDR